VNIKGFQRLCSILIAVVCLLSVPSSVHARNSLGSQTGPTNLSSNDFDQDGIDDATELRLAKIYAPLLIFDEGEQDDIRNNVFPLFQVSPITFSNGESGAMLVFVFLYDMDYGADFDQGWTDWFTDPIDTAAGLIMDPFDQFFGMHCGDTEVIYFFIVNYGNWDNTRLESIYWKRHYDDIYQTSDDEVSYGDVGDGYGPTHPIIYVSEDKHGMYPNHDDCEDYKTDVVKEKLEDAAGYVVPGALEELIYIPVTPKMEDCSGGLEIYYNNLSPNWNVGESISSDTMNTHALDGTFYEGYNPWENEKFYGRTDTVKVCEGAAGGLGGKWCGTPFPVGSDHPCARPGWWLSGSSGQCMNYGTDRYGSDYNAIEMVADDPAPCVQACVNDPNCVSYSFVRPGYQGENAYCYLKNDAPAEYDNDCCVSGLRTDCP